MRLNGWDVLIRSSSGFHLYYQGKIIEGRWHRPLFRSEEISMYVFVLYSDWNQLRELYECRDYLLLKAWLPNSFLMEHRVCLQDMRIDPPMNDGTLPVAMSWSLASNSISAPKFTEPVQPIDWKRCGF